MITKTTLLVQVPNDIIIEIFKYTDITTKTKLKMIMIFPWLSKLIPICEICKERKSYFIQHKFNKFKYICRTNCFNPSSIDFSIDSLNEKYVYKVCIQIQPLPSIKEIICKFIKDHLVKDDDQKILKTIMISRFRIYTWNAYKESIITMIFDNELEHDSQYYLNYQYFNKGLLCLIDGLSDDSESDESEYNYV